ncbi:MAG: pyridoxamine 5'-phosphate oxidase [Bacteroidota bacterium]
MAIGNQLSDMRQEYAQAALDRADVAANPFEQFESWLKAAIEHCQIEPNAMTLATVEDGRPTTRVVLLKGLDARGLMFYTNYESRKAQDMGKNPFVCLNFWWPELERQVRVEGKVERLSDEESDQYFQSRGRGSRLGAWASPQSRVLENREELEQKVQEITARFEGQETFAKPDHWGGYLVRPDYFEFWQGRKSRLHDRLAYRKQGEDWQIDRLAP